MIRRPSKSAPGFFDLFFENPADRRHRELCEAIRNQSSSQARATGEARAQSNEARAGVEELALVVAALLRTLSDKGLVTPAELQERFDAIDLADGEKDGRVTVDALRAILGFKPPPPPEPKPASTLRRYQK